VVLAESISLAVRCLMPTVMAADLATDLFAIIG